MKYIISVSLVIILAITLRLWFVSYTNYTAEDSYITFQFSRNIMRGDGFTLNPGQLVYGTTTPLLTFILAGWLLINPNIVLGSRIIDVLGVLAGMIFLFLAIPNKRTVIIVLFIMAISARLFIEEMQGMEMPLTFLFLSASFYGFIKQKPYFAGIMAGLMLWSRVDAVVWAGCLLLAYLILDFRNGIKYFLATTVIYLPWIIFSWIYFGSPIPMTVTAKIVAYGMHSAPFIDQVQTIIRYISLPTTILILLSIPSVMKNKAFWVFPIFMIFEFFQLALTGTTYFYRYFYLLTLVGYIILGFGISESVNYFIMKKSENKNYLVPIYIILIACFSMNSIVGSTEYKFKQEIRQNMLTEMGQWFNEQTPPNSTIMLEPIGYVGWYADRILIDEVGLVTPRVVDLYRQNFPSRELFRVFWPDYMVWTCGEENIPKLEINQYYTLVKVFDAHASRSCYDIWQIKNTAYDIQ